MRKLLALLGAFPLVYTMDHDGEQRLRVAHFRRSYFPDSPNQYWVQGAGLLWFRLMPEGKISPEGYALRWIEWPRNRKHVVFAGPTSPAPKV